MGVVVSIAAALVPIVSTVVRLITSLRSDPVHANPTLANIRTVGDQQHLIQLARQDAQAAREEAEEAVREAEEAARREEAARDEAQRAIREVEERAREEREAAQRALRAAEEAGREAVRAAEEESQRAKAAQETADQAAKAAKEKAQAAKQAQEEAEERLKKGIQPVVVPSPQEVASTKRKVEYKEGLFHFAVAGVAGSGKSSLINAFRGLRNQSPGAAATGVTETTLAISRLTDPNTENPFVWYDLPGAGTLKIPDWQYFNAQGLYVFDCIIIVFDNRFTMTDIAILTNCKRFKIPTYIVRSKADSHIRNIMRENGYDSEEDDDARTKRKALYKAAREQYTAETRANIQRNLKDARLPDQRVYIVSNDTLYSIVKEQTLPTKMIDELELLRDLFSEAHSRRCVPRRSLP
ncbi:hypothetical protein HYDPIDRAFT_139551 [Hydnomerulius pinastri MD-312]|uniref:IRG-type G domain-containing protein n=1 Tax=Hydnomerulius pinastri MD-312 TaxID=994086 RepID=A0A0C9V4A7_9AGAM|nr:hypothetical protein HYDPIDRAFT_139551 [Hydnomerulius pinastri MD-312]